MGFFGHYISTDALPRLKEYHYNSTGSSLLEKPFNVWWTLVAKLVPERVAPNLLTLGGFVCAALNSFLTIYATTNWSNLHHNVFLFTALLLFFYQTLDAIDGKQARKTGSSSPVGQCFDHGCDAVTTLLLAYGTCLLMQLNHFTLYWVLFSLQLYLFYFTWWDMHFHTFRCSLGFIGVTEVELVVMIIHIVAGTFGPSILLAEIGDLLPFQFQNPTLQLLAHFRITVTGLYVCSLIFPLFIIRDLIKVFSSLSKFPFAKVQLLGFLIHLIFQFIFIYSVEFNNAHMTFVVVLMTNSTLVTRMLISAVCKMPCPAIHWPNLPFYVCSIIFAIKKFQPNYIFFVSTSNIVFFLAAWNTLYFCDFANVCINDMCHYLDIRCFSINTKPFHPKSY